MSIFDGISGELKGMAVAYQRKRFISSEGRGSLSTEDFQAYLTPEEIHNILVDATRAVITPGLMPRVENDKTVHRQTAANGTWGTSTVSIRVIEGLRELIGEMCDLATKAPGAVRYYQFGEWFIELQIGNGYYMETFGNAARVAFGSWNAEHRRFELGANYSAMMTNGQFQAALATGFARKWLAGKPIAGVNSGTANTVVAMLLSEALRNYRTFLINLMCLDLIDWGDLRWSELPDAYHPMARGGTYERGVTGFAGGEKDGTTRLYEKVLTMNWLQRVNTRDGVYAYMTDNRLAPIPEVSRFDRAEAISKLKSKLFARAYKTEQMPKSL